MSKVDMIFLPKEKSTRVKGWGVLSRGAAQKVGDIMVHAQFSKISSGSGGHDAFQLGASDIKLHLSVGNAALQFVLKLSCPVVFSHTRKVLGRTPVERLSLSRWPAVFRLTGT